MSSSFRYTFTKFRSRPSSAYRCLRRPSYFFVRSASSSPTVAPLTSTDSFLSVKGRSGVGMLMVFGMGQVFLIESGAIFTKAPRRHVLWRTAADGDDHVRERRPGVVEVVLRRSGRVVRMRVVEAEQLGSELRRARLGLAIVLRADEEAAARPILGGVGQRERGGHGAVVSVQRAAALVGIGLDAVRADGFGDAIQQRQAHAARSPRSRREPGAGCVPDSSQNRSERYFS